MTDQFSTHFSGLDDPARDAQAVVPDDGADLPQPCRAIYVGTAGALRARMVSGAEVTFAHLEAGQIYPLRLSRVLSTGTSAAALVALR